MKRLTIFLIIFVTLTMGLIAFFGVKTNAAPNIQFYESRKIYFKDFSEGYYVGPNDYDFDLSYLDNYYNYFIFNFGDYSSYGVYTDGPLAFFNIKTGGGLLIVDRNDLKWEITFSNDFETNEYYIIAYNYEFVSNLNESLRNIAIDFRNLGISEGTSLGYQDAIDVGYNWGLEDGKILGFNEGKQKGLLEGAAAANDFSFMGLVSQVFVGLGSLLAINLLPGISIGAIISVPIVFGIIWFIIGKRGGKGD